MSRKRWFLALGGLAGAAAVAAIAAAGYLIFLGEPVEAGGPPAMRLISAEQYRNTIAGLFGPDVLVDANFPVLQRQDGLVALGAASATMTPSAFDQFDRAARSVAAQALDPQHRSTLVPCAPKQTTRADSACAQIFLSTVGRMLYRRPLTRPETAELVALANAGAAARGDFYQGLGYGLQALLSSPKFLYISETVEPDPRRRGRYRLDADSRASRLSLLLWDALPDDELLTAASRGDLDSRGGLRRQVDRMLASPRMEAGVRGFFGDFLQLQDFETVSKDPLIYPAFTYAAASAVHEQTLRMITHQLLDERGDYRDLFTTNQTFINRDLGPIYRTAVRSDAGDAWAPLETPKDESAGILTAISFVAAHSHPGRSSPTLRGRAIREIFLCQKLPDPPPTVNFTVFDNLSGKLTARDRLKAHVTDSACSGCHRLTDPLGLGFEHYDGAGEYRATEHRARIDTRGELDGKPFSGAAEVGKDLHDHPALISCLTHRVYAYGAAHSPGPADRRWLGWVGRRFAASGYRLPQLLRTLAESDGFYAVSPAAADPATVAQSTAPSPGQGGS